jgi:tRNA-specific 2-thiouridylase
VRHRAPLVDATIVADGERVKVHLAQPDRAIAAGQSVVIYVGEVCLGGGIVA